jgi:GntR family transcriptional regulator
VIFMAVGVPRYIQLAEVLRQRISGGQYPVGSRLPTEVDLVEETGYSRDTVRAAVRLLRESGWVTVTHGLGTFINPPEDRKTP